MTVEVKTKPGQLPTFWDRDVIFFANMLSIFYDNHDELERLRQQIMGVETYGGRFVPIINLIFKGDNNLLVLEKPPDQSLVRYFREDLGLSLPDIVILSHSVYDSLITQVDKLLHDEISSTVTTIHQHDAWLMRNVRFARPLRDTCLLKMLDQAGYLYHPDMQEGVLPINFNLNEDGSVQKGQFLCLGRVMDDCLNMLEQIESILPLRWYYDRD